MYDRLHDKGRNNASHLSVVECMTVSLITVIYMVFFFVIYFILKLGNKIQLLNFLIVIVPSYFLFLFTLNKILFFSVDVCQLHEGLPTAFLLYRLQSFCKSTEIHFWQSNPEPCHF